MPPPSAIHEAPFKYFSKCVDRLLGNLSLDPGSDVTWAFSFNGSLDNVNDGSTVPDFRLDLESPRMPHPFWVGESGFSSSFPDMQRKLKLAATIIPDIDLSIIVNIHEWKFVLPSAQHPLLSAPPLPRSAFQTPDGFTLEDTVVVGGVEWLKLKKIQFHVAIRGFDGEFEFETGPLSAEGVRSFLFLRGDIHLHVL